ncbi:MAG: ribosome maturation factor RimP [Deltaproteobacteria bacterium]|nr:ribosome maturation factor RimP [Deltaproteobacteria bacterium]
MFDEKVIDNVREILDPLLLDEGLELVDVQYKREGRGKILRIYIDKQGGITIGDCAKISRELGTLLDVHDIVPGSYTLEVSSPGLDRPLKKPKDFERFKGKKVKIKTKNDIQERKVFVGRLLDFINDEALVEVDGRTYFVPYNEIEKANLELDF